MPGATAPANSPEADTPPVSPEETAPSKESACSPIEEEEDEEQEMESPYQGGPSSPSGPDPLPDLPEGVPKLPDIGNFQTQKKHALMWRSSIPLEKRQQLLNARLSRKSLLP